MRVSPRFALLAGAISALGCAQGAPLPGGSRASPAVVRHDEAEIPGGEPARPDSSAAPVQPPPPADGAQPGREPPRPALVNPTDKELRRLALSDPSSLGPLSFGAPGAGSLQNAVKLEDSALWRVMYPETSWTTDETARYLSSALEVASTSGVPRVYVGEISAEWGGYLSPHKSHQSGRDVDIGYPRLDGRWWADATRQTLDATSTWRLLRALVTEADVEVIFVDRSVARLIAPHAIKLGEDAAWVKGLFDLDGSPHPLIRHEPEHKNHLHVRFFNPVAQHRAQVVHDLLATGVPRVPPVVIPPRRLPPGR